MNKKELEKFIKSKLKKDGVNEEWMKKHLIVDTITKEDIEEYQKGDKNE